MAPGRFAVREDDLWLAGLCVARVAFTLTFMTYAATLTLLQRDWNMSASQAGLIHSAFHVGYLVSLFGVGFLGDRFGAKRVFLISSGAAALASFSFALFAQGFLSALLLHGLTALCSGGSYTPVLAVIAQRIPPARRGRAVGYYIAAASLGYAFSLLLSGLVMEAGGWRAAFFATASGPALGLGLALWVLRGTPNFPPEPEAEPARRVTIRDAVVTNKPALLVLAGYTFHSWELLGMRAWLPAFLAVALLTATRGATEAASLAATLSAVMMAAAICGNIVGGALSDRWGRTAVMLLMALTSIGCSFTIGWLVAWPVWVAVAVGLLYHFSAIADSPVYSTALTEVVPPRFLGAAYSLRSVTGFGAGAASAFVFGLVLDWAQGGPSGASPLAWGLAFATLGLGGLTGPLATLWLRHSPESRVMAGGLR